MLTLSLNKQNYLIPVTLKDSRLLVREFGHNYGEVYDPVDNLRGFPLFDLKMLLDTFQEINLVH